MFKQNEIKDSKNAETVIGESVKVKGDFTAKGNIVIEGTLSGSIKTASDLFVGEKANVNASIVAKNAHIEGVVAGNIKVAELLEIGSKAKITGDVQATSISVAKGATINGQYSMNNAEETQLKKEVKTK